MPGGYRHIHDNPEHRRRAQVVFVDKATNDVILRLHETDIVRVKPNGDVILSTGGWATHKTINGMNDALELFDMYVEADGNPPRGNWQVYDVDGTKIRYTNSKENYIITIKANGDDAHNRCKWLAEAFGVPYNPTVKATGQPKVVSAPPAPAGMQPAPVVVAAPVAVAAVPAAPQPVPVAVAAPVAVPTASALAPPPRQQGSSSSWARVAAAGVHAPTRTSAAAPAPRMTGPGTARSSQAPTPASPGNGSLRALDVARQKLAGAAPAKPVQQQLAEHMSQLGIHDDELEDDTHLCVVCMEALRTIVLVPCGHMALCKQCCQTIIVDQGKECPLCCQPVEYHVEVDA